MTEFIYILLGLILIYHLVRFFTTWKGKFPFAEPGSEFEQIIMKSESDEEFRRFTVTYTAFLSQFISSVTIITLFFIFIWGKEAEKTLSIVFSLLELSNIAFSEHIISLSIALPGEAKPLWLIVFNRFRSLTAIVSILSFGYFKFL